MRLAALSLVAVLTAFVVAAPSAVGSITSGPFQRTTPRPFDHTRHEKRVECRECHGAGDQHRTVLVRTAVDCASCHHDTRRGFTCSTCHATATLPEDRAVTATFALTVRDTPDTRVLPFGHVRHERVACAECHQTPVTLRRSRECRSCHAQHEQRDADCASCHASDVRSQHGAEAHLTCAGAGCHETRAAFQPAASRNTCIACHPQQRAHEADGNCATCHKVPAVTGPAAVRRGGQP